MEISKSNQPKIRQEQIKLLEAHLSNPGRFSILIIGDRGTGKKFWLAKIDAVKTKPIIVNASLTEASKSYWESQFKQADKGTFVVEDVEGLTKENQAILFEGLATVNGAFGFESKKYEVQIIFTSSKNISILRDSEKYLTHKFFDRIAQLVVRFPNFNECANTISDDLKHTWNKFEFNTAYPLLLENWLQKVAHTLHGNFRDLDKLCINWNNYQLMHKKEEAILKLIEKDFSEYYRFPESKKEDMPNVHFSREKKYRDALHDFQLEFKKWAKEEYGTLRKAANEMGVSARTMERW